VGFLIHGVTGSGKTEIYLHAITETLAHGRQAIVLVPEIALTPQTVARFAGRFPGRVTVIHSGLSRGERYDVWRKVRDGEFDVVVGPRSALFAPLARLGLIVVDEEHEASYKQDAEVWGSYKIFYDARATARKLAELAGGVVILGSATPSLESYYAAQQGELTLLTMPRRVMGHGAAASAALANTPVAYGELPPVEIIDMRLELRAGNRSILSRSLQAELRTTLDAGQQAILFLNRRGSSTFVMCRDCGHVEECTRCNEP
jgi:primosomal protein N' (replication factor Y)